MIQLQRRGGECQKYFVLVIKNEIPFLSAELSSFFPLIEKKKTSYSQRTGVETPSKLSGHMYDIAATIESLFFYVKPILFYS